MDLIKFFGRFHILVLHLPIGILMIAAIIIQLQKIKKLSFLQPLQIAVPFLLFMGTITAIKACILGYLLSIDGGYKPEAVSFHQWMGITLSLVAAILTFLAYKKKELFSKVAFLSSFVILGLVTVTGHAGGNLTHGETFLFEHGPDFVKKAAGIEITPEEEDVASLEEAKMYPHIIKPILSKTCISCHSSSKQKGGLDLSSFEKVMKGGKTSLAVVAGDLEKSELYQRITLPEDHKKFMPTDGKKPLTQQQVEVIALWIEKGAANDQIVAELTLSEEEISLLEKETNFSGDGTSSIEPTVTKVDVSLLEKNGFHVNQLPGGMLDVSFIPQANKKLTDENLESLLAFKDQILWLKLSRNEIVDKHLEIVAQLSSIQKLWLDNTSVTASGVNQLQRLEKLVFLNLYGTSIPPSSVTLENVKTIIFPQPLAS